MFSRLYLEALAVGWLPDKFLDGHLTTVIFLSSANFFNKPAPIQKKLQRKPIFITTPYIDLLYI